MRLGKRTAASCSAGLLAHCVYPIVLSNPFTSTTVSSIPSAPVTEKKRPRKKNIHWSFALIGTPCSGPFKRPVAANSASSLRASSLASSKNTTKYSSRAQESDPRTNENNEDGARTLSETIHRLLRLRRARNISFEHSRRGPRSSLYILHNL